MAKRICIRNFFNDQKFAKKKFDIKAGIEKFFVGSPIRNSLTRKFLLLRLNCATNPLPVTSRSELNLIQSLLDTVKFVGT